MAGAAGGEALELPLRGDGSQDGPAAEALGAERRSQASSRSGSAAGSVAKSVLECCTPRRLAGVLADAVASIAFWYAALFVELPEWADWAALGSFLLTMALWRAYRARSARKSGAEAVPYTCGHVKRGEKDMFLVATVHISPRAPVDVEDVINRTRPDVAMIELDDERLDRMHDPNVAEEAPEPRAEQLQAVTLRLPGGEATTIHAQRALWNGEWKGEVRTGSIAFDADNAYGLRASGGQRLGGGFALVHRGGPSGEFAPFALKAHYAAWHGAEGLFVINSQSRLPLNRVGGSDTIGNDLRIFRRTGSCGFPPVPTLLLSKEDGERLRAACSGGGEEAPWAEFCVMPDGYPRRSLRKRLCQAVALLFSGIGVLYGVIECFAVDVGSEFLAAEAAAAARGIPCACIDVDLNRFWSRLGRALAPTPWNLLNSFLSWLAFPRVCFQFLYPPLGNIDVAGSMVLHMLSFSCRTWTAFLLAGLCASVVMNLVLHLLGMAGVAAAERSGAVHVDSQHDRDVVTTYAILAAELYLLPQIYDAVAASRDEAMYRSIVRKLRRCGARRVVVVVGAGHANGILQRARSQGF